MKTRRFPNLVYAILCVFLLSGLAYINESVSQDERLATTSSPVNSDRALTQKSAPVTFHKINVELFPDRKIVHVNHWLTWVNRTDSSAAEVQFHIYPNAFSNNSTVYLKGRNQILTRGSGMKIMTVKINGKDSKLLYFQPEVKNENDSTVARILLNENVLPGDSVKFFFEYDVLLTNEVKRFGYASGRNFFFISQWYIKPGVFDNGKWICSQYHPFTNFYSDFGSYDITITVPDDYTVGSSGGAEVPKEKSGRKQKYHVVQDLIHDFAWMASDEIIREQDYYRRKDGTGVKLICFIQPENIKYKHRFINTLKNSLSFMEENIGRYPYSTLSLVDAPRTSQAGGMEYPTLITVGAELFSPEETLQPEYVTAHEFVHQYFYAVVANNEVYEAWLDEGLTSYISTKIMQKYYGTALISFDLFNYYPVFGLNLLSYNEIPLIYSLGHFYYPEGSSSLARYLRSPQLYAISDTSYLLPDGFTYGNASYSKPELVLISLERYLGFNTMMNIFRDYYNTYKFRHPSGSDFLNIIQKHSSEDLSWFFDNLFYSSSVFDYKIKYVRKTDTYGTYEVYAERPGDGVFRQDIALYTDKDTLLKKWDGKERWKVFRFYTEDEVIGAEIDPFRKNILDVNYSNNSYFIKYQYGGSIGLTFRWFFWMQNLLLILGSIA